MKGLLYAFVPADDDFLRSASHLQLDDSQQVPLRSLEDGAALSEVDGIRLPPAVGVVKHFRGCVLHRHTLLQTGLQTQTYE